MNMKILFLSSFWIIITSAMEDPTEIQPHQSGVFLDEIVSVYKNPVVVHVMPLEIDRSRCRVSGDLHKAQPLAFGCKDHTLLKSRLIPMLYHQMTAHACLRIKDLWDEQNYTYVWLRKELESNGKTIFESTNAKSNRAEFQECENQRFQTLVTLKLYEKNALQSRMASCSIPHIEVVSKTVVCLIQNRKGIIKPE